MEISATSVSVFCLGKILGLAPFALKTHKKGEIAIERSKLFTAYSIFLCLSNVILIIVGFKENCKVNLRANSTTLRVTSAIDVIIVVLASAAGVGCGVFGLSSTQEVNLRLRRFDNSLQIFTKNAKNARNIAGVMAITTLAVCVGLLSFDYYVLVQSSSGQLTAEQKLKTTLMWYLPLYVRYIAVFWSHILYANSAWGFGRRLKHLNRILKTEFSAEQTKATKHQLFADLPLGKAKLRADLLRTLADNYESLSKCVEIFSNTFGFSMLCNLISCLVHLVITAHFIIFLAMKNPDNYLITLAMWLILHIFRLVLVVEMCQMVTAQSEKTRQLVIEIKRKTHEPVELKRFLHQLIAFDVKFSVMGIYKINRNILTAFGSAIATYLVMVTQFQSASG